MDERQENSKKMIKCRIRLNDLNLLHILLNIPDLFCINLFDVVVATNQVCTATMN